MIPVNRQITLAARPIGFPKESDFKLIESPVPTAGANELLIRTIYLSVDPYMRGQMNDRQSYVRPIQLGQVMTGGVVGKVVQSNRSDFAEGTIVEGLLGWQDFAATDGRGLRKVDPAIAPISTALGVLGTPGFTAYFGLLDICNPRSGETVLVSAAAGAVGSLVGQIAKIRGCRVVGVAGSDDKANYVTRELGFDAGFNYKSVSNYVYILKKVCPRGIDVYFDNVGGGLTDAVFQVLNERARISLCGQISQYNLEKPEFGPRLLWKLIETRSRVEGFLVTDFAPRYREASQQLAEWLRTGRIKYREEIAEGLVQAPRAFIGMLRGQNIGKQLVKVSDV